MAVDSASIISGLGAGSGMDTTAIVSAIVEAERAPKQAQIDRGKEKAETQISAYGIVKSSLNTLKVAFDQLKDTSDFAWYQVNNPNTSNYLVSASVDAQPGAHTLEVYALATADRRISGAFATTDASVNAGNPVELTIGVGDPPVNQTLTIDDDTVDGVVNALNNADLGVSARIVDTGLAGFPYKIVLEGASGAENTFSVSTNGASDLSFDTQLATAADAVFVLDGVTMFRSSNSVTNAIAGVTLDLGAVTSSETRFEIQQDKTEVESALRNLVATYNDLNVVFSELANPDGTEELSGALIADGTFRMLRQDVKNMITAASTTPSGNMTYLADLGISFTRQGTLEINESRLAEALTNEYADIAQMFSAGTENQSVFNADSQGFAGEASKKLDRLLATTGTITTVVKNAEEKLADYAVELEELEDRMAQIESRYISQFTAMEQLIDQMNSTRDYLKSQLENLPFTSNND